MWPQVNVEPCQHLTISFCKDRLDVCIDSMQSQHTIKEINPIIREQCNLLSHYHSYSGWMLDTGSGEEDGGRMLASASGARGSELKEQINDWLPCV